MLRCTFSFYQNWNRTQLRTNRILLLAPIGKSSLCRPANSCTPIDNSKITRIRQVEYRDLLAELIGFARWITRICQLLSEVFKKLKMKTRGNMSKSQSLNPGQVHLNIDSSFNKKGIAYTTKATAL